MMFMQVKDPTPAPAEVLIPEARNHQKRRYLRTGLVAGLAALVVAALIAGAVALLGGSPPGTGSERPAATAVAAPSPSYVYFRPVLCAAPSYAAQGAPTPLNSLPSCSAASLRTASNLDDTVPLGTTIDVGSDVAFAAVPSTARSADRPSATVLLTALPGAAFPRTARLVLGPAQMTNASMGSAVARKAYPGGPWVVDYTTTASGAPRWDRVANENFHQQLAIDFDGTVVSAPLIQPTQAAFSSFEGHGEIGGSFTRAEAVALAHALRPHKS
jgi:hypothetical protein